MTTTTNPDTIEVTCDAGHVSYYNKRDVCGSNGIVWRGLEPEPEGATDSLLLPCRQPGCKLKTLIEVDCRGYR